MKSPLKMCKEKSLKQKVAIWHKNILNPFLKLYFLYGIARNQKVKLNSFPCTIGIVQLGFGFFLNKKQYI